MDAWFRGERLLAEGNSNGTANASSSPAAQNVVQKALQVLGEAVATTQRQPTSGAPANVGRRRVGVPASTAMARGTRKSNVQFVKLRFAFPRRWRD